MKWVYIVLRNDVVDKVFEDSADAEAYRLELQKKWNIAKIISKEVF